MRETLIESDLRRVLDIQMHTWDLYPNIEPDHVEVCEGLHPTQTNCNYLSDRAMLCSQRYSKYWMWFANCYLSLSLKSDPFNPLAAGTVDETGRMRGNPRANSSTHDWQLDACGLTMSDLEDLSEFKSCVYGEEGDKIRLENREATAKIFKHLNMDPEVVWMMIDGKLVTDPSTEGMGNSRKNWQKKLAPAICAAYKGDASKLPSCAGLATNVTDTLTV